MLTVSRSYHISFLSSHNCPWEDCYCSLSLTEEQTDAQRRGNSPAAPAQVSGEVVLHQAGGFQNSGFYPSRRLGGLFFFFFKYLSVFSCVSINNLYFLFNKQVLYGFFFNIFFNKLSNAVQASSNQLQLALSVLPFEISKASHGFSFCLVLQPIIWPEDWYLGIHGMLTRFGAGALLHFTTCLKNRPSSSLDGLRVIHSDCGENIQRLLIGRENLQKTCEMGKTVFSCPLSFAVPFPELLFPLLPPRPFSEPWPIPYCTPPSALSQSQPIRVSLLPHPRL